MAKESVRKGNVKKAGKSLKEKRAAKKAKHVSLPAELIPTAR